MKKGRCETMTHDHKRHGTITLFAALNVLDGSVILLHDLLRRASVLGRDLLMQTVRSVRQKIAVLVHGAALHQRLRPNQAQCLLQPRRAIDD